MAIKNIVFDIGRVLKGWNPDLVPFFGEKAGKETYDAIWTSGLWAQIDLGIIPDDELLRQMIAKSPQREKEIRWVWDHLDHISEYYSYSAPWIRSLKKEGYHVYYLSNYSERVRKQVPHTLEFLPEMDGGVFSCDVKMVKPDPAIYQYLCKKYGLIPEECLFLDDVQENVDGAIRIGMHSLRFEGYEKSLPVIRAYLKENGAPEPREEVRPLIPYRKWKRIMVYGDSNTYGWDPRDCFGTPYEYPWTRIFAEKTGIEVINRGEPGREIPKSSLSINWLCRDLEKNAPVDALWIMLGSNDILNDPHPAAGKIAEKMEEFLLKLREEGSFRKLPEILLIVPPMLRTDVPAHQRVSKELAAEYKVLADKYEILYRDASALKLPLAFDGVHFTEEGHRMLGEWLAE